MADYMEIAREFMKERKLKKQEEQINNELEAAKAEELLEAQGWCIVKSTVLDELIVWAADKHVAIPARWKGAVKYTLEELRELTKEPLPNKEELKQIHKAKKEFNGKIKPLNSIEKEV